MCYNCMGSCRNMFDFVTNCSNNEEKIKTYIKTNGMSSNGQIDLKNAIKCIRSIGEDDENMKADVSPSVNDNISHISHGENIGSGGCEIVGGDAEAYERMENDGILKENVDSISGDYVKTEKSELMEDDVDIKSEDISQKGESAKANPLPTPRSSSVPIYRCPECPYESKYHGNLQRHVQIHKDDSEITMHGCPQCSYEGKSKDYLRSHMLTHKDNSKVTLHECTSCTFKSKHKRSFRRHLLTHKESCEVTMFRCAECNYVNKYESHFRNHMLTHNKGCEEAKFRCLQCSFESTSREDLQRHTLSHRDVKRAAYKCTECSFESRRNIDLQKHLSLHRDNPGVATHKCAQCNFESRYKNSLKRHMLVHS